MYSKPLSTRMDGVRDTPARVKRGAALNGAVNFSSFMPHGQTKTPAASGQGAPGMFPGGTVPGLTIPGALHQNGISSPIAMMPGAQNQGMTPMEQAAAQSNLGLNQMRALAALNGSPETGPQQGGAAQPDAKPNLGLPLNPNDLYRLLTRSKPNLESAETAIRVNAHRKKHAAESPMPKAEEPLPRKAAGVPAAVRQNIVSETGTAIGTLAAQFESGSSGIAAIGYDRHGGTSYGKYQLSSRAGTMGKFIEYCKTEAPDIAQRLQNCGGSLNPGGRRGKMPAEWVAIAEEQPARFEALQDKFIRATHFEPAMRAIAEKIGAPSGEMPFALQEVVFSTAVQHGPGAAARIIARAVGQLGENKLDPQNNEPTSLAKAHETLIRKIYDNRSGQFRSSTETVQMAVKNRLRQEMSLAISMLRQEQVTT